MEIFKEPTFYVMAAIIAALLISQFKNSKRKVEVKVKEQMPQAELSKDQLYFNLSVDRAVDYLTDVRSQNIKDKKIVAEVASILSDHTIAYKSQNTKLYEEIAKRIKREFPEASYVYIEKIS